MPYQITEVEFDFTDDLGKSIPKIIQDRIRNNTIGKVYYAESPDFIADEISDDTGWCVRSLSYNDV